MTRTMLTLAAGTAIGLDGLTQTRVLAVILYAWDAKVLVIPEPPKKGK